MHIYDGLENFKKEYRINKWKKVLEFFKQRGFVYDKEKQCRNFTQRKN